MSNEVDILNGTDLSEIDQQEITERLRKAKHGEKEKEKNFKDVEVVRKGNQITLPKGMSYRKGINWLQKKEEEEETIIRIHSNIKCYPLDGALAFSRALYEIYGFTQLKATPGFFGDTPPAMIKVQTGVDSFEQVPWGRMQPPGIEGFLETGADFQGNPVFVISGKVKQKNKEEVALIIKKTEKYIKEKSIYKGKAVRVNLEYMDDPELFQVEGSAPEFMDVSGTDESSIILNKDTEFEIKSAIWSRIKNPELMIKNNIPLKHGALLMGSYGTGKTLTATVTANLAEKHGWTFIYLKNVEHLANALRFAEMYAPAVLFSEDVDKAIEGDERTVSTNDILNTIDGVDTKGKPIITVLTTNHPENINKALLRAGRIDSVIKMEAPDERSAEKFVELFAGNHLAEDIDLTQVGKSLAGVVPAFIEEAVNKARLYAMSRMDGDEQSLEGCLTTEDILMAATSQKGHIEMVEKQNDIHPDTATVDHIKKSFAGVMRDFDV